MSTMTLNSRLRLYVELVGLDGFEADIFPEAGHTGDELVGADAGVEDGMEGCSAHKQSALMEGYTCRMIKPTE